MDTMQMGVSAAVGAAVLWTLSTLAWDLAGRRIGAVAVSCLRLVIVCPMFILYGGLVNGRWLPLDADARTWGLMGLSGFFGFLCCDLCIFKAFLLIGARLALLLLSLTPPMTAIISWCFLGDHLLWHQWLGMAVTLAGVVWVVLEEPETMPESGKRPHFWRGISLGAIGATSAAIGYVLSKKGIGHYDPFGAAFIRVLGAMAGYLVVIPLLGGWMRMVKAVRNGSIMVIMIWGTIVGPFVGVVWSLIALRDCQAGVAATILSTIPVLYLPFTIFFFREKVSLRAVGGAVLAVAGITLLVWGTK
jgi:drug/metabolite transporter (DMT)-like permease